MVMESTTTKRERKVTVIDKPAPDLVWHTLLFNCYCHETEEVIHQVMVAIGCTYAPALILVNEVEHKGFAEIFSGSKNDCDKVADILCSIGLDVVVSQ